MTHPVAVVVAGVALSSLAAPTLGWEIVRKSGAESVALKAMEFSSALVWQLGYGAQIVVACQAGNELTLQLVLLRVEPVTRDAVYSTIAVTTADGERWESSAWPQSFTDTDVTLIAERKDGIEDLILRMVRQPQATVVEFDGVYGWNAKISAPRRDGTDGAVRLFSSMCPK